MYASIPTYAPIKASNPLKSDDDYEVQPSALAKAFAAIPVMKNAPPNPRTCAYSELPAKLPANTSDDARHQHLLDTLQHKIATTAPSEYGTLPEGYSRVNIPDDMRAAYQQLQRQSTIPQSVYQQLPESYLRAAYQQLQRQSTIPQSAYQQLPESYLRATVSSAASIAPVSLQPVLMSSDSHMSADPRNAVVESSVVKLERQATLVENNELLTTFMATVSENSSMPQLIAEALATHNCQALHLMQEIFQMPNISLDVILPYNEAVNIVQFCINRSERESKAGFDFLMTKFTKYMKAHGAISIPELKDAIEYAFKVGIMIDAMGKLYDDHHDGIYLICDLSATSHNAETCLYAPIKDVRLLKAPQPILNIHPDPKRTVIRFSQSKPGSMAFSYINEVGVVSHSLIIYRFDLPAGNRGWSIVENGKTTPIVYPTMTELLKKCKLFNTIYPNYPVVNL